MSQYKEEQLGEIFSLESIYPDELESICYEIYSLLLNWMLFNVCFFLVIEEEPYHQFKLQVKSEGHDAETEIGYGCSLKFTYTPSYPDEALIVEILDAVNMDDMQIERLKERLEKDAEENLGMVSWTCVIMQGLH